MKPTLVVLAAGMGSRYGGLKQLDSFGPSGETIIDYSIYDAVKADFGKVVFVIREDLLKDFQEVYFDKYADKIKIDYVFQELDNLPPGVSLPADRVKPWGTGHAVLMAKDKVAEPFAVINGDDFYGASSFTAMAKYLGKMNPAQLDALLVGFALKNTLSEHGYVSRGVCDVNGENHLKGITERTKITKGLDGNIYFEEGQEKFPLDENQVVSMNLMGFTPAVFELMESMFNDFIKANSTELKTEFYIPKVLDEIAKKQPVSVIKSSEKWLGVTYKEDKPVVIKQLMQMTEEGIYPSKLW